MGSLAGQLAVPKSRAPPQKKKPEVLLQQLVFQLPGPCFIDKLRMFTPPKFNIDPEEWWLEDYFPIGKVTVQGLSGVPARK